MSDTPPTAEHDPPERFARRRRPHRWTCRHCSMVEDYRLQRDAELRLCEGVHGQDEDHPPPVVFKTWLQVFEWPPDPSTL